MLLSGIFFTASAQKIVVGDIESPIVKIQGDLRDIMYADHSSNTSFKARRYADPEDAVVSYKDRIKNMPDYLHDFINKYVEAGNAVLAGGSNWLSNPSLGTVDEYGRCYYLIKEIKGTTKFNFTVGASTSEIREAAKNALEDIKEGEVDVMNSFGPYAFLSVNFDHPEFFWIGNGYDIDVISKYSISYYPDDDFGDMDYTIEIRFNLISDGFDIRCSGIDTYNFRNTTNLANGVKKFNNYKQTILTECKKHGTRYDRLITAHDWLTQHNRYNTYFPYYTQTQIGDTPWSAYSAMEGNNGQQAPVCEGYTRAFKVLCDAMDIPCIMMSGKTNYQGSNEEHTWNYVQMENGKWYAVDVTWDDPRIDGNSDVVSGSESHKWFLLGSSTDVGEGVTFIETHPEQWLEKYPSQGSYPWDLKPGPELSPIAWTPAIVLGKCAKPTISYAAGKLKFSCETEGVKFISAINNNDIKTYDTEEVDLSVTYTISVYATKDDYENSELATATLCWIEYKPATEGITDEDAVMEMKAMPVLVQSQGGTITIQGAADGTPIDIYDASGKKHGTAVSEKANATIGTSLRPGSVAIVKIGEKSIKVVVK